ncbi:MAG: MFS transporter [Acidobacteriota bacterium]
MPTPPASPNSFPPPPSPRYAWYVVGVLTLIYVFSFIDRQILSLLVGPVRRDLHISDTGMSLLMGFSFAVFYTFFGLPIGRLADSANRRGIIAAGFVAWSLFTAACGLMQTFWQMALMRMGVGIGEASLSPSAYSMISDYFPPERRATAISVYSMGIYLGHGVAMILGGLVLQFASRQELWNLPLVGPTRPWQLIFFAVGLPGLLCALLLLTVREPKRREVQSTTAVPFWEVLRYMRLNLRTFLCHNFGIAFVALAAYGAAAWTPTLFIRTHGWTPAETGFKVGLAVLLFGPAGIVCGGRLADYLRSRGHRDANLRVMFLAAVCWLPFSVAFALAPTPELALLLFAPCQFILASPFGVAPAAITEIMPNEMRGQAAASYLFVNTLIGMGFGPTAIALMTDYVFHDEAMLPYSMAAVAAVSLTIAAAILHRGLKPFVGSLDRLKELQKQPVTI